jgi:hypothetical protein
MTTAPAIAFGDKFIASLNDLAPSDAQRATKAVERFSKDPQHPSLRLKPLQGDRSGRLHSIRAADDIRVILVQEGSTFVVLEAGSRQDIYDRYDRGRFVYNQGRGFIGVVEQRVTADATQGGVEQATRAPIADDAPGIFDHWGDEDLRDAGFDDPQIKALRACKNEDQLCDLGWSDEDFDRAVDLIELTPEQWRAPALISDVPVAEERLREVIQSFGALHGLSPLFSPEEVAKIAAAPIEDWMIFLHPDQRAVVERRFDGPARVRGAAGTGKTVVALHRAAVLANRFAEEDATLPILFTTYIKTLPPVFESLYRRLPNSVDGRVEFVHVDKLARRICNEAGIRVNTSPRDIDAAFAKAHRGVVGTGTPLAKAQLTAEYLKTEIQAVIKGRGVESKDTYLDLVRTGRRTPFTAPMREQLWELMQVWYDEMGRRNTVDFSDVMLLARDAARKRASPTYRAAIIDEAQDITMVGVQLVRALVNGPGKDVTDGLLLVGDGAQRIYAGGFTLRQAGVQVAGRATVLHTNYRNTAEILDAAMAVAGDEAVDDLGEEYKRGEDAVATARAGGLRPGLVLCSDAQDEALYVVRRVKELVDDKGIGLGDIGVFVPTNREVEKWLQTLREAGIARLGLEDYSGKPTANVKVGTFFRAKGLEFKVVFLPGLNTRFPRPPSPGQDPTEYEEDKALAISQLFVAMTRARDALILLSPGEPSRVLAEHLDAFELMES